jgi:hypothetical protein
MPPSGRDAVPTPKFQRKILPLSSGTKSDKFLKNPEFH